MCNRVVEHLPSTLKGWDTMSTQEKKKKDTEPGGWGMTTERRTKETLI